MKASLRHKIEHALADGPGTAADIAAELDRNSRLTGAYLRDLWRRGALTRRAYYPPERGPSIRRVVWMYSI